MCAGVWVCVRRAYHVFEVRVTPRECQCAGSVAADRTAAAVRPEQRERHTADRDRETETEPDRPSDRRERQLEMETVERDGDREAGRRDRQQRKPIITDDYFRWRTTQTLVSLGCH